MKEEIINYNKILEIITNVRPEKSDSIVWLQGDRYDRAEKVLQLFRDCYAPKIVLSGNNMITGKISDRETNDIPLDKLSIWLKKRGIKDNSIFIDDQSYNTLDQASNVIRMAIERKWKKIILVASFYHQPRAFLTCLESKKRFGWKGEIINQSTEVNWEIIPGGRTKSSKDYSFEEIEKIKKYNNDLVNIEEGIDYLLKNN